MSYILEINFKINIVVVKSFYEHDNKFSPRILLDRLIGARIGAIRDHGDFIDGDNFPGTSFQKGLWVQFFNINITALIIT